MEISHLYHDATFGGPTIELDVKEQIKTREVNAREERALERKSKSFERAKDILEKNSVWERWKVGQTLKGIYERSPQLERSLAMEKARVEALQRALLARSWKREGVTMEAENNNLGRSPTARKRSSRGRRGKERRKKKQQADGIHLNTDVSKGNQRQADFVKRSDHVVKALARINWRKASRQRDHEKFKEELIQYSKPVMDRARVVLKGREDMDVDQFLKDFQSYLLQEQQYDPRYEETDLGNRLGTLKLKSTKQSRSKNKFIPHGGKSQDKGSQLTQGNVLFLDKEQGEHAQVLSLSNTTSSTDLTLIASQNSEANASSHLESSGTLESGLGNMQSVEDNPASASSDCEKLKTFTASSSGFLESSGENVHQEEAQRSDSENFLPPIKSGKFFSQDDSILAKTKQSKGKVFTDDSSVGSRIDVNNNVTNSSDSTPIKESNRNSKNSLPSNRSEIKTRGANSFSPSASISQIILEEEENILDKANPATDTTTGASSPRSVSQQKSTNMVIYAKSQPFTKHFPSIFQSSNDLSRASSSYFTNSDQTFSNRSSFVNDKQNQSRSRFQDGDDQGQGKGPTYNLPCAVGLPKLWKQPLGPQKEKPQQEVSAAMLARKHKRKRNNMQRMY